MTLTEDIKVPAEQRTRDDTDPIDRQSVADEVCSESRQDRFVIALEIPDFISERKVDSTPELQNPEVLSGLALEAVLLGYDPYDSGRVQGTPMPQRRNLRLLEALLKRHGDNPPRHA